MIEFLKIENVYDPNFEEVFHLYNAAFPSYLRRSWTGIEMLLSKKPAFHSIYVKHKKDFAGLIHYWTFDKFVFIEHFAIQPDRRNKGLGSKILKKFLSDITLPVIIETELPRNLVASKRIHFYERLGLFVTSNFYMQPPYEGSQVMMSMLIMSTDYQFTNKHFNQIKNTLYKEVYKYDQKKEIAKKGL